MREIAELVDVPDPAWEWLVGDLACSLARYTIFRPDPDSCRTALHQIQTTASSRLGAVILNTGGILMHDGLLRIYGGSGGGPTGMPSISEVNEFSSVVEPGWQPSAGLVIAHDVLGGVFAINGIEPKLHGRPGDPGDVVYFCPSTVVWQDTGMDYDRWLNWLVDGGAAYHYRNVLWSTWRAETAELSLREGISIYPAPWSDKADQGATATFRVAFPMEKILDAHIASCALLSLPHPGELGAVKP